MKQLTIEHLAPYLPYGLNVQLKSKKATRSGKKLSNYIGVLHGVYQNYGDDISVVFREDEEIIDLNCDEIKPILRNLSDLTKEIEHNGEKFVPIEVLLENVHSDFKESLKHDIGNWRLKWDTLPYWVIQKLFEWHFDCFNLINNNLAIDINKI